MTRVSRDEGPPWLRVLAASWSPASDPETVR